MDRGYINTPVRQEYQLFVDDVHQLYIEECGNPDGIPVLFLHGGPGGSINEQSRRFFNPDFYRIILFDQRGTGKSTPFLSLMNNTPLDSVKDIEVIRNYLNIDEWIVFGGSYGSTLALIYAIYHSERVMHLVLRGIFLGRLDDINWLYNGGAGQFYPEQFEKFKNNIPEAKQEDLVTAYYDLMIKSDKKRSDKAYKAWSDWEGGITRIIPQFADDKVITNNDRSLALLEAHYFANRMFWNEDNYILNRIQEFDQIPMDIIHGRYDVDCRLSGAFELAQAYPLANLHIVEMGAHDPYEAPMMKQLLIIMDKLALTYK